MDNWFPLLSQRAIALSIALILLFCIVFGSFHFVRRLYRADRVGRRSVLLWSVLPALLGAVLGLLDGPGEGEFLGFLLAGAAAILISVVALTLRIPEHTRTLLGTILFEGLALLVLTYAGVSLTASLTW